MPQSGTKEFGCSLTVNQKFHLSLHFIVAAPEPDHENHISSSSSLLLFYTLLACNGARGSTRLQMARSLGLIKTELEASDEALVEAASALGSRLNSLLTSDGEDEPSNAGQEGLAGAAKSGGVIALAIGVFVQQGYPIEDTFLNAMKQIFKAQIGHVRLHETLYSGIFRLISWVKKALKPVEKLDILVVSDCSRQKSKSFHQVVTFACKGVGKVVYISDKLGCIEAKFVYQRLRVHRCVGNGSDTFFLSSCLYFNSIGMIQRPHKG
ncbi:unnamed protein product [Protopolystoma xenopodis]|uniref:Serpin domain-containing protein n=1 Tax=Protopolystoma xenopodis TaxID=117903 RepID=A0A448XH12_9PLAT|nr:unnamed protein product [Protopolystoma xenopodis]